MNKIKLAWSRIHELCQTICELAAGSDVEIEFVNNTSSISCYAECLYDIANDSAKKCEDLQLHNNDLLDQVADLSARVIHLQEELDKWGIHPKTREA